MCQRIVFSILAAVFWLAILAYSVVDASTPSGATCAVTYIVQSGDTFNKIAQRHGVTPEDLRRANSQVVDPDRIYSGQKLCIPLSAGVSALPSQVDPGGQAFAIEATYRYIPTGTETEWIKTPYKPVGRRAVYPLDPETPIVFADDTRQLIGLLSSAPGPILLGAQDAGQAYTLIGVGDAQVFSALMLEPLEALRGPLSALVNKTTDECWAPQPVAILGSARVVSPTVNALLEQGKSVSPFQITHVGFLARPELAARCYALGLADMIQFALLPSGEGHANTYRLVMRRPSVQHKVTIAAFYQLSDDEIRAGVGPRVVGQRFELSIASVEAYSDTKGIVNALAITTPVLLGVQTGPNALTHELIAIGSGDLLLPLALTTTKALTDVLPLMATGASEDCEPAPMTVFGGQVVTTTVQIPMGDGIYLPYSVTNVALKPDYIWAPTCYASNTSLIHFAFLPADGPGTYRLIVRLNGGSLFGPAGATRSWRCASWPRSSWFYRWLRTWYGCGR